ncbi:MAG: twin-arginine translocation signal domain-containing protein [Jatrophihabitantaceae bacterium]
MSGLAERLVNRIAGRAGKAGPSRRGFLGGAAVLGAALAVDPWSYLTRPASAYDAVCGADNTCAAGYTVFCCTINAGSNTCPPDSFIGGWWKADASNFCGGSARYYIDCNAYRDGRYSCHCNNTTCDQRRVACNQFRYGQCNTQIPYSNTGPVLCRVVSCTPPWVQYGATCSSSAATDNNTATHSAPCLSGHPPVGTLESATASGNLVQLKGWAYDPDLPASSVRLVVYQDGKPLTVVTANHARPDVNAARHITGNHGFTLTLAATTGTHNYACHAINIGGGSGNTLIGVHNVAVNLGSPPTGSLERASAVGNQVTLSGWAFDRDAPGSSVRVVIYVDDKPYTVITTSVARPDVNAAFHITGNHGYRLQLTATPGRHNYKVYALNLGKGSGAPLIGMHNVVVGSAAAGAHPAGPSSLGTRSAGASSLGAQPASAAAGTGNRLEVVSATDSGVRITGWASDPADPTVALPIAISENGELMHWLEAGHQPRFEVMVPAAAGLHRYSVHAFTQAGQELTIGNHAVAVTQAGPVGELEQLDAFGAAIRIAGWAYHPDQPSASVPITVWRDGAPLSRHEAGLARPDINRQYGAAGDPGFDVIIDALPGRHTYTVYAASLQAGQPDQLIGSRTIEITPADLPWTGAST